MSPFGSILVIDDEPLMLQSIRIMLGSQGYDVINMNDQNERAMASSWYLVCFRF